MIPILYLENETNFNHNGIGQLHEVIDYEVTEVRNGEFELMLEYPVSGLWFSELTDLRIISAEPNNGEEAHNFRIYDIVKSLATQSVIVYASSKTNDVGGNMVRSVTISNETGQQAMDKLKAGLIEPTNMNFVSDIQTVTSTKWENRNALNCIAGEQGSLIQYWGGEIKRTNDTIYLYSRRGKDNVAVIKPGKNLKGFDMTVSTKGLITAILPTFKMVPEDGSEQVTITGDVVYSPLAGNYPVSKITPVDYSGNESVTTLEELNAKALVYFSDTNPGCDEPKVKLTIDMMQLSDSSEYERFKDLEKIQLTDTVTVWVEAFDIDVVVKVTEVVYDGMARRIKKLTAGTPSVTFYDSVRNTYQDDINYLKDYADTIVNGVRNQIQLTADSKNTIFRGYTEPSGDIAKVNDLWYKELGSGEVEIRIFDGAYWQPLITAGMNEATRLAVQSALTEAEQATTDAAQAYLDSVAEADRLVTVQTAAFDAEMTLRKGEITAMQNDINLRVTKGEVVSQLNIDAGRVLIQTDKLLLDADTYIMGTAFVTDVKAKSIEAVNANIASIRTSILTADVITSGMVATSTALITKLFATDATVTTLTGKTAFINSIKAITISADKITAGTLNAANVNLINLNANSITTGTLTGANMWLNLATGVMQYTNPTTGAMMSMTQGRLQYQTGQSVYYQYYDANGLTVRPSDSNTGDGHNTGMTLIGNKTYFDFLKRGSINDYDARIIFNETDLPNALQIRNTLGAIYLRTNSSTPVRVQDNYVSFVTLDKATTFQSDGYLRCGHIAQNTTSATANVHIRSDGIMFMIGSASKYKSDIQLLKDEVGYAKRILDLRPKSWIDKGEQERGDVRGRYYGVIAEDVEALGLSDYTSKNDDGGLESVQYDRLWTLLLPVVREQETEIKNLKQELVDIKAMLA